MRKLLVVISSVFGVLLALASLLYVLGRFEYQRWQRNVAQLQTATFSGSRTTGGSSDSGSGAPTFASFLESTYERLLDHEEVFLVKLDTQLDIDEELRFSCNAPYEGKYYVVLSFEYLDLTSANASFELTVNRRTVFQGFLDNFVTYDYSRKANDRYGHEIVPEQLPVAGRLHSFLKDSRRTSGKPLALSLKAGQNTIELKNLRKRVQLDTIYFVPVRLLEDRPSYETYAELTKKKVESSVRVRSSGGSAIVVEAETLFGKSDQLSSVANVQTSAVTPYEALRKRINVVDENTFKNAGQELFWAFFVEQPGFYRLGFRYTQTLNQGVPVFRRIRIDGAVPFREFDSLPFDYTGYRWVDKILPYEVFLDRGWHVVSLEADTGLYERTITFLRSTVRKLQAIGLDIRKLVGTNLDPNRTWDIEKYMPGVLSTLERIARSLRSEYERLLRVVGQRGRPAIAELVLSAELIEKILRKPERLPFFLDELSEGSSSVAQRLSELATRLKEQPLGLDKLYIVSGRLPPSLGGFSPWLVSAYEEIEKLWLSLLNRNEPYSIYEERGTGELSVWVNRPIQYVETLQYLIDTDFTVKTGIRVSLSLMPNEQRLILAAASGRAPDVALSISNWIPFELGIRKALHPLSEFDDFFEFASENINIETLLPMVIEDKVYGITETQNFYVLYYRKDILEKLKVPIPDTWDDVKKILPELQRRAMNFFIPMCEQPVKYFNTTGPFFFQHEASLYTKDGFRASLGEENSVKAFELMTELFSVYGMPEQVVSFYNGFRYGRYPLGVGDFGLYVLLSNAADELYGLWDIAPSPGVLGPDGTVRRYQVAGDRADVIFASSKMKEEAWTFLKWWLSTETQVRFAKLLVNRYGPTYLWNTANLNAFRELDFIDERHKRVVLEQWKWIREVQRHPGGYMTEREISNVWNRVVIEGYALRPSIDRATIVINRELERKLTEFGYMREGRRVKEYRMYKSMEEFLMENPRYSLTVGSKRGG